MPKLSIVVPFYGVEKYIGECLDSLQAQTFADFEVVLVDDESPDGSRAVVEPYVDSDPRFRLITKANGGIGPARNTGVEHAVGEYLAFVDSDDILAPRAYSLMVDTLDRTGSDFCAGNALRFSSTDGTRQSWTHAQPFAKTRYATTIGEFPALIRDRMVWNRVFRRSFWDAGGYVFPAIRYEDYPIALQTHLDAEAVDLHSEHVYFWRDRESGDSITQRVFDAGNARDRVTSAHMVLDMLQAAPRTVSDAVQAYLVDVDLVALAGAIEAAPPQVTAELAGLAMGLARRIPLPEPGRVTRLARLVHQGLLSGDLELVTALSRWREGGGTRRLVSDLVSERRFAALGSVLSAVTTRRRPQNPLTPRRLRAELVESRMTDEALHLTVHVVLRGQFAQRVTGRVTYETNGEDLPLPTTYRVVPGGLDLDVVLTADTIAPLADPAGRLSVSLSLATLRWQGQVKVQPEVLPPLWQVTPALALQGQRVPDTWFLGFERVLDPVTVSGIAPTETGFELTVSEQTGELAIGLPYPTKDVVVPIVDGRATIDVTSLQAIDVPDNPVTREVSRPIGIRRPATSGSVQFHETFETDGKDRPSAMELVLPSTPWDSLTLPYLTVAPLSAVFGDEVVTVGAGVDGLAVVTRVPVGEHLGARDEPGAGSEDG